MIISVLTENTAKNEHYKCEHGLCLHIATEKHKILFDTGATALFSENASTMDIDLSKVDMAILSHGHLDHGGGLKTFLEINETAKVYARKKAFGKFYLNKSNGEKMYAGLDESLLPNDRFVLVEGDLVLDKGLELFSNVKGDKFNPSENIQLLEKVGDEFQQDEFAHEQNLVVQENDKTLLVAGCAHRGIVNIMEHFQNKCGRFPDYVIGGFHLYNRKADKSEDPAIIDAISESLLATGSKFYTCHCTGLTPYKRLKSNMGEKIDYLASGEQLTI